MGDLLRWFWFWKRRRAEWQRVDRLLTALERESVFIRSVETELADIVTQAMRDADEKGVQDE